MKTYFILDDRANYDVDDACIVECFEAADNAVALLYLRDNYFGFDYVLTNDKSEIIY
jgi:hypothetical protein